MRFGALLLTLGAAAALAACASPTSRFYTLAGGDAHALPSGAATPAPFYFELAPVDVPQQVARNQLVVQTSPAQVRVLEEERWASLPADELRRALSSDITQRLGAIDVYGTPHPESAQLYRVKVNVQRFESWPDSKAVIDAVWSVRATGSQTVLTCRTVAQESVGAGTDALVEGHRKAVDQLASAISAGVQSLRSLPAAPVATSKSKPVAAPVLPCPVASTTASAGAQ